MRATDTTPMLDEVLAANGMTAWPHRDQGHADACCRRVRISATQAAMKP